MVTWVWDPVSVTWMSWKTLAASSPSITSWDSALNPFIHPSLPRHSVGTVATPAPYEAQGLGSEIRVRSLGFRVQGLGFRVPGSGFWVQGSGFRV